MSQSNLPIAEGYYSSMVAGDYGKMETYLHDNVEYVDPRWPLSGKVQVLQIAKSFAAAVATLTTVAKFEADDKVMLVHDVKFHNADKPLRSAVLIAFAGGLIKEIQLIADTSQHVEVCTQIFA
ncbi:MAG: nuclear transport factor 2 family protein [Burkholderiales bacterium]|nr:nuclear transport factor 2 family protein [Burkholderiales bacterium]